MLASLFLLSLAQHAYPMVSQGRPEHGLIGYGIEMYKPPCAHACRDTISNSQLNCSEAMEDTHSGVSGMDMGGEIVTEPECYATDDIYLQTLAYCISTHCHHVEKWKLEQYWAKYTVGRDAGQPDPKETYQQALAKVTEAPTKTLVSGDPLNQTSLVNEDDYTMNYNGDANFENVENIHEKYGIVLLVTGAAIPITLSLLRFIPFPSRFVSLFNAYIIDPPVLGTKHSQPVFGLLHLPTRGQALFILYLVVVNIALTFAGLGAPGWPDAWYATVNAQWRTYLSNRTGVLSFANLPLLILYAGRNNVLLWVTNWSHSTFLLLHRYVAWICTLQAVVHSIIYLQEYLADGEHATESKLPYWIWGVVATLCLSIAPICALYPIRKAMYEAFLLWHNVLAIFAVVGCYYHIICRFQHQWGYETWIYVAIAVWGFDRTLRLGRLLRNGVKTATVTVIDDDYIRVNITGVSDSGHAYLYFPTLTWRIWENHPFSVASTVLAQSPSNPSKHHSDDVDVEKSGITSSVAQSSDSQSETSSTKKTSAEIGLTFLLRIQGGITAQIRSKPSLPVLVESGYGAHADLSAHPFLLCIAGGVGITACVPYLRAHPNRARLLWGVRTTSIVDDLSSALAGVDKEIFVGKRMDIVEVLKRELSPKEDSVVLVSGPNGMADDARVAVSALGRRGYRVRLVEEAFSW